MPNLRGKSWKKSQRKPVMTLALRWQNCPVNNYYTINRILLLCIGLWPCQKSVFRHIAVAFTTIMLVSGIMFQVRLLFFSILLILYYFIVYLIPRLVKRSTLKH